MLEKSPYLLTEHKTKALVQAKIRSLLAHRNPYWQLSRDGNSQGSALSHVTTVLAKPSFTARGRVVNAVVGRGNAGRTMAMLALHIPAHAGTAPDGLPPPLPPR